MDRQAPIRRTYLREWRKFRKLTQEQLAEKLGVNRSWISMIETGEKQYTQEFLEGAAIALNCEPADLLVRDPQDPTGYWQVWDGIPSADRPRFAAALEALRKTGS